jgi:N6-adenosine-specific RNA methylase IME4
MARVARIDFTDDEIETIKKVLDDWGFEYSLKADPEKVTALCKKLGVARGDDDFYAPTPWSSSR